MKNYSIRSQLNWQKQSFSCRFTLSHSTRTIFHGTLIVNGFNGAKERYTHNCGKDWQKFSSKYLNKQLFPTHIQYFPHPMMAHANLALTRGVFHLGLFLVIPPLYLFSELHFSNRWLRRLFILCVTTCPIRCLCPMFFSSTSKNVSLR